MTSISASVVKIAPFVVSLLIIFESGAIVYINFILKYITNRAKGHLNIKNIDVIIFTNFASNILGNNKLSKKFPKPINPNINTISNIIIIIRNIDFIFLFI